eukprot:TRINITY_DN28166_c0_g1_i6.p1 TRINITY_DN28166_c0_g1~~TRINITY_DN28166_c0_g1_i6.p1  ORF type:complete len:274 (+),score=-13.43 TRINITY_DN28166_c0_g1_i6:641-1462(+)
MEVNYLDSNKYLINNYLIILLILDNKSIIIPKICLSNKFSLQRDRYLFFKFDINLTLQNKSQNISSVSKSSCPINIDNNIITSVFYPVQKTIIPSQHAQKDINLLLYIYRFRNISLNSFLNPNIRNKSKTFFSNFENRETNKQQFYVMHTLFIHFWLKTGLKQKGQYVSNEYKQWIPNTPKFGVSTIYKNLVFSNQMVKNFYLNTKLEFLINILQENSSSRYSCSNNQMYNPTHSLRTSTGGRSTQPLILFQIKKLKPTKQKYISLIYVKIDK